MEVGTHTHKHTQTEKFLYSMKTWTNNVGRHKQDDDEEKQVYIKTWTNNVEFHEHDDDEVVTQ